MFAESEVTIQVRDEKNTELVFPISLVDRAEDFDLFMGNVAELIENRAGSATSPGRQLHSR